MTLVDGVIELNAFAIVFAELFQGLGLEICQKVGDSGNRVKGLRVAVHCCYESSDAIYLAQVRFLRFRIIFRGTFSLKRETLEGAVQLATGPEETEEADEHDSHCRMGPEPERDDLWARGRQELQFLK